MPYKYLTIAVLVSVGFCALSPLAHSQNSRFVDKSDPVLKEWLVKYLAADAPGGYSIVNGANGPEGVPNMVSVDGSAIDPRMEIIRLVNRKDWAVEMILQKITEIRTRPEFGDYEFFLFASFIIDSNRSDTLEIIISRFKDDPKFRDLIHSVLAQSVSSRYPEAPQMWYRALESSNPMIVSEALPLLSEIFADPAHDFRRMWAIALVDRYGHSPTALEMATDPIFKAAQERNPEKAAQTRATMLGLTEREYLRRQLPAPVVVKQ
ncbi:MAG: hypothetical protein NTV52_00850 [Acidobacteria bacterium]|nr:hypothetical protein [Acidobacteriota bacterium]